MHITPNNRIHYRLCDKSCTNKFTGNISCEDIIIPAALGSAFILGMATCCLIAGCMNKEKHHCRCK